MLHAWKRSAVNAGLLWLPLCTILVTLHNEKLKKKKLAGYHVCESNYCSGVSSTPNRMSPTIIKDAHPAQAEVSFI